MRAIDRFLPDYHVHERHAIHVNASPALVQRAIQEVTLAEMPVAGLLFWLRGIPTRLLGSSFRGGRLETPGFANKPILQGALGGGFVLLEDIPEHELVVGTIGKFWQLSGGAYRVPDAAAFLAFDRPDYARSALDFRLEPAPTGGVRLTTETRVQIPDPASRRRFTRYWRVVYPGSALIRLIWLRAIKQRAERLA